MSLECTIRPAAPDETEAIFVVHVAAIIAHGPSAYTEKQVAAWAAKTDGTDRYAASIEDPSTEIVVAEVNERIVGFGELDVGNGEIESIFVDPDWGERGIGSSLLRHFEQRLRDEGFSRVRLRAALNAVGFYERRGYDPGERVTTRTTNDVALESRWMEKPI
ncbi:GNAT family N-acetyltransferase [Halopiger aswanensis]|uniref:GNAT family acetyltransferase n=1 Tax=Halopiger aswanensis TaxID=148449 RepID=A0A3R7HGS9_9EURY|nr:GNAT family N-acetyltransferase [Halopiger aswanensis]RKD93271.1 GNAT family acetyltransferase [Halopiger aswanensis]